MNERTMALPSHRMPSLAMAFLLCLLFSSVFIVQSFQGTATFHSSVPQKSIIAASEGELIRSGTLQNSKIGDNASAKWQRKAFESESGSSTTKPSRIRSVNLGGWLVIEGWIQPSLFDGIPDNDLLDGKQIQIQSVTLGTYVSAEGGGGQNLVVNRQSASGWETFKIWRVKDGSYQLRVFGNQFVSAENGGGGIITANRLTPSTWETFQIIRNPKDPHIVHIQVLNGMYIQAVNPNQLMADFSGEPNWDNNSATFRLNIFGGLQGDFQLGNGYGTTRAPAVYQKHRDEFVTEDDFTFLSSNGINAVRIPVGWWIASDPNPPYPYVGGSLQALDNAFEWGSKHGIYIIVDLHAAPGSQNGQEHSSSRDGTSEWAKAGTDNINHTITVIDFLAARYAENPMFLGLELLNEPNAGYVPLDTLLSYFNRGYETVRKHSSTAYVVMCQRIGADPHELIGISNGRNNVVLDLHYYNLFTDYFTNLTVQQNIDYIYKNRVGELSSLNSANGLLTFVGEWVNEWDVKSATKEEYDAFGKAQLEVYGNASLGWAYWTIKNVQEHWSFEFNVKEGYLPQLQAGA